TERSRLSGTTMDLVAVMGKSLGGEGFSPYVEPLGGAVMRLCGRTNRVFSSRAQKTLIGLLQDTQLPSFLPLLCDGLKEKSKLMRLGVAEPLRIGMEIWSKGEVERDVVVLEDVLVHGVQDPAPDVRVKCRATFTLYAAMFPDRQERYVIANKKGVRARLFKRTNE
ncbi:clasp N-terminal domain-containing protein, partial [Piptocephalis cylindrospora]